MKKYSKLNHSLTVTPLLDPKMNINLKTQREQLMEDIDCIIESFFADTWGDEYQSDRDELTRTLCDAVVKRFPA